LCGLCVRGLAALVLTTTGEANAEQTKLVSVGGGNVGVGLDEGVPLAHQRAELVSGEVHAVEGGQGMSAFNFFTSELELAVCIFFGVVLELTKRQGEHTTKKVVTGKLVSCGLGGDGPASVSLFEDRGGLDGEPILTGERIDDFTAASLSLLSQLFVFLSWCTFDRQSFFE